MVIAKIKLCPGNAGWYDPTTGIHLTIARPIAEVKAEMNLNRIRSGLAYHTIQLIDGSVAEEEVISKVEQQIQEAIEDIQESVAGVVEDVNEMQGTIGQIHEEVTKDAVPASLDGDATKKTRKTITKKKDE